METNANAADKNHNGLPANSVLIPIIVAIGILLAIIGSLIAAVNKSSNKLARTLQDSGAYIEEITSFLIGANLLSESSSAFVLRPLTDSGGVNVQPLMSYAYELKNDRRGDKIMNDFKGYDIAQKAKDELHTAVDLSNNMYAIQLHALALVTDVYPLPDITALEGIPIPALKGEEINWSDEDKLINAQNMIAFSAYTMSKHGLDSAILKCTDAIKDEMGERVDEAEMYIAGLRSALWASMLAITVLLIAMFILLYNQVIFPLLDFVQLISTDHRLDEGAGLEEVRKLAFAYNGLLRRRDALDGILRSAAETDVLTNLPNRYGMERCILDLEEKGGSAAIVLFDVNYLKQTNDTLGHAFGDKLLRDSADCIKESFGDHEMHNCFRYGGDEFAAVLKDVTPKDIEQMIQGFKQGQKKRGISIAYGIAYTENIRTTCCQDLMAKADKEMYDVKKSMHARGGF